MSAQRQSELDISFDHESPDKILEEDLKDRRLEKLSTRVTLLTILIPCLIGVILVVAYLDIKDRVTRTYDTGTRGVQQLSENLDSKFSSLSLKIAGLEENATKVAEKVAALEKTAAFVQSRLRDAQKSVVALKSSKADQKEINAALKAVKQSLAPIPEKIDALQAESRKDDQQLNQEITAATEAFKSLQKEYLKVQADMAVLRTTKIDSDTLDAALESERQNYEDTLGQKTATLEEQLNTLEKQVANLSKKLAATRQPAPAKPKPKAPAPAPKPKAPAPSTAPNASQPAPGKIIEQTLE
jgi:DNA repair exonuclease SbcCD ATPase subunit